MKTIRPAVLKRLRYWRATMNARGWLHSLRTRAQKERQQERQEQDAKRYVQKMTNWQRTQWARAGYPKGRTAEFAALERRPQQQTETAE